MDSIIAVVVVLVVLIGIGVAIATLFMTPTPVQTRPAPAVPRPYVPPATPAPATPNRLRRLYRTEDGRELYDFSLERQPGGDWRIYITSQPGYGSRGSSSYVVHRLNDGPRHYICWEGRIGSVVDAERIAATWADNTQTYIRTGRFAPR